jgi:hypothetical protein
MLRPSLAWEQFCSWDRHGHFQEQTKPRLRMRLCSEILAAYSFPVSTIWVKWPPKPDPVKRRPPTTRLFYLAELAVPLGYMFVT